MIYGFHLVAFWRDGRAGKQAETRRQFPVEFWWAMFVTVDDAVVAYN